MRQWTFELIFNEGTDEWLHNLSQKNGNEELKQVVIESLELNGFSEEENFEINLIDYTNAG